MKLKFYLLLILSTFFFELVDAQETKDWTDDFSASGYADIFYTYNFNQPESGLNGGRIFDTKHNTFSLGLIQAQLAYNYDKLEVMADLTFGPNANLGNFGNQGTAVLLKQAYVAYAFTDKLKLTVGQFGTHIGYEVIEANANFNYSLSYLFGNGPFYHTGAKLDFAASEHIEFMVGLLNGWDALQDYNDKKSIGFQTHIAPSEQVDIYLNWIGGDEYDGVSNFGTHKGSFVNLYDLTSSFTISDPFHVGINAAYGTFKTGASERTDDDPWSEDADWYGVALYADYAISDIFKLGIRGEHFNDKKGVRYFGPVVVNSLTLTGHIGLSNEHFMVKPEIRFDQSQDPFFEKKDEGLVHSQATFGVAFIGSF